MRSLIATFALLAAVVSSAHGYKILVYSPSLSRSHLISNARVADVLARDGHEVTLLQLDYSGDYQLKLVEHARLWTESFDWPNRLAAFDSAAFAKKLFSKGNLLSDYIRMIAWQKRLSDACQHLVKAESLMQKIEDERFDVYIGEQLNLCGSGVSHATKIPIHILLHSCPMLQHVSSFIGLLMPTSHVPTVGGYGGITDKMSMADRFANFVYATFEWVFHTFGAYQTTRVFREQFGSDFPGVDQIVGSSPLVLISVDEFVDFPRPTAHHVLYIGGLGIEDPKNTTLTAPFDSEMEKGKKGVILISFGSIVPTNFPGPMLENFVSMIRSLDDYHFIFKVDKSDTKVHEATQGLPNVFLTDWAPQTLLLSHKRLKLFVTHGGYNSVVESAFFGVPLIVLGFFGDQMQNAMVVERNGWGLSMPKGELLSPTTVLEQKTRLVLEDDCFARAAKRTQRLIKTKPMSAEKRLTSHMRFLEQNGGRLPELQTEGRNLSIVEFYNLDLLFIGLALFVFGIMILVKVLRAVCYLLGSRKQKTA